MLTEHAAHDARALHVGLRDAFARWTAFLVGLVAARAARRSAACRRASERFNELLASTRARRTAFDIRQVIAVGTLQIARRGQISGTRFGR